MPRKCTRNEFLFRVLREGGTPQEYDEYDDTIREVTRNLVRKKGYTRRLSTYPEDLAQRTHERLLQLHRAGRIDHGTNFEGLVATVAFNLMSNDWKKQRPLHFDDLAKDPRTSILDQPLERLFSREQLHHAHEFMDRQLSDVDAEIMRLVYEDGLSRAEITERMAMSSVDAVKKRISRARSELRRYTGRPRARSRRVRRR